MARRKTTGRRTAKSGPARRALKSRRPTGRGTGRRRARRKTGGKKRRVARGFSQRFARYGANAGAFLLTLGVGFAIGLVFLARDLPSTKGLWRSGKAPAVVLTANDGAPLVIRGQSRGAPVRLAELPPHVPEAIMAIEDRNFRHHVGVNPLAVARALFVNLSNGEIRQGGSTITQQLAKNLFLSSEQTYKRKIQELMLAFWLEMRFSKDELLTLYLNRVYFGAGAYGVDAASHRYFAKPARMLSLGEAAILAGLLKAPSRYAPTNSPDAAGGRARLVLDAMVEAGFVTPDEAAAAAARPIYLGPSQFSRAPYFVDYAVAAAREASRHADANLVVRTTLRPVLQAALEDGLAAGLKQAGAPADLEAAAVIVDKEGAVRAMAGGRNYAKSQFNRASDAYRQPGSAFKPIVYLAAFEAGWRLDDRIEDAPLVVDGWSPDNYGEEFYGETTLREAMARSMNAATVALQEAVGRRDVAALAGALGLDVGGGGEAALALGVKETTPLALAGVYAAIANGGFRVRVHAIERVADDQGTILYRKGASMSESVASRAAISALNDALRASVEWGTGVRARIPGAAVAGKTGTSQAGRDAWFAGYAGDLVCVVWLGRDDDRPVEGLTGGADAAVVWREIMSRALIGDTPLAPDAPPDAIDAALEDLAFGRPG